MKRIAPIALVLVSSLALAADWPHWRGLDFENRSPETGLLKSWPADGPKLAWKIADLGAGYSTVAVAKGRIYTAGDKGESSYVHALDLTGQILWSSKLGRSGERGGYHGPRAQPTVDADFIYMQGQFGDVVCYEAGSGKEVWRKHLRNDFKGEVGGWGYSESVIIDGDNLICTPGGREGTMLALNKKTGEQVWRTTDVRDGAEYVSPVIATIGGVKQYVQMTGRSVMGVAPDGKVLWRADRPGKTATIPTPIVHQDTVFVASGYGVGCNAFKVTRKGGSFQAEQVYENKNMVNHHGGMIRVGDHVYGYSDGKGWVCLKLADGEMVWSDKTIGKGAITYADGHLILRAEGGRGSIALIEATPAGYKQTGRFDQPDRSNKNSWPHPVVAGGKLYIRDQDILLCYDVK